MTGERLPKEVIDHIFSYLHHDKRVLKVCSLVCKTWLYPAYRRLFYDIDTRLSWDRLRTAFDPRSGSNAAPFIRRLHIGYGSTAGWNETFPSLDGFQSVTSLSIASLPWDEISPTIRSTISHRFVAIVRLKLERVVTTSFSELAEVICTFRCLESLILGSTVWHESNKTYHLLRLPQNLHALELYGSSFIEILEWLCSFGQDLTLRNVCFLNPSEHHYQAINAFLQVLGPSLESFRIRLEGVSRLNLHHNTRLRSLHLGVRRMRESDTGLKPLLSRITSMHIEHVSLSVLQYPAFGNDVFYNRVLLEWGDVDAILARREFWNLKSVGVRHVQYNPHGVDVQHPFEWFFDRLPLCHNQGILRLCEPGTWGPF